MALICWENGTIIPALSSMLHLYYYARNYPGILCKPLVDAFTSWYKCLVQKKL